MYRVLIFILAAAVTGNVLLLCVAVLLFLILKRIQTRTRAREPETPSENDRQRGKIAQEDAEAWRQMMSYNVKDAYGMGGSG